MHKAVVGLSILALLCLALSGVLAWQQTRIAALESALAEANIADVPGARGVLEDELQRRGAEIEALQMQLEDARAELQRRRAESEVAANEAAAPVEAGEEMPKDAPRGSSMGKAIAGQMNNPQMRRMIEAQQRATIEVLYGDVLAQMDLTEEERERVMEILIERQLKGVELGMSMMGGELSPEEFAEIQGQIAENLGSSREALEEVLGEEDFAYLDRFEKSQNERQVIDSLKAQLPEELSLSLDQEDALMNAMYDERVAFDWTIDFSDPDSGMDVMNLNEEKLAKWRAEQQRLDERVYERASGILDAAQMSSFRQAREQHRQTMEMGLRMAMQVFGSDEPPRQGPERPPAE